MKRFHTVLLLSVWALTAMTGCDKKPAPYGDFDNKVFIDQNTNVATLLVKQNTESDERSFHAATPKPVDKEIGLLFDADAGRVADYNRIAGEEAAILPENYYEIVGGQTSIPAGTNRSADVTVRFHNLGELDTEALHVLPVTLQKADGMAMLESARTIYYVLRGAALINVVADLQESNYIAFDKVLDGESASCGVLNGLNAITMEALIRCSDYVLEPGIKTVMGIEGHCLIRISDDGLEPNQLQVVMPSASATANFTDKATCLIPANEWTHIAVTCDVSTGRLVVYINGEVALDKSGNSFLSINFGQPRIDTQQQKHFFNIGYSYTAGRELHGEICEARIWNIVRTQEQIAANVYEVDPGSEGLVAYWKFDEGSGETIRDHTGNNNNGTAHEKLKWNPVSLPEAPSAGAIN
ncbi:DUF1735 and LamG domain-containing protein [Gallalistipes aquisgranensis]|uniref:DUF1735 and LamG domain-containing protein n=1 Tax=Gallalistipes aquisgranensis TaxID=2779358 RepID=UPI001CF8A1DC|nr:DUF1735 and LamG domain-containing protein [Gallalistipes aquisgranensis]MBE5033221.1 DUF1735 domain-containing protein [Gallalistipes aquisgranensis]